MLDEMTLENKMPLKGRSREVYLDLCKYIETLPEGCSLPSLRELQRKYSAGQQTIVNALKLLDKNDKLVRIPRKKVKVTASKAVNSPHNLWVNITPPWISKSQSTDVVLAMNQAQVAIWQPIVDRYNQESSRRIKIVPHYDLNSIAANDAGGKCDFALFGTNPITLGIIRNTSLFMDMRELVKEIELNEVFNSAFVRDPKLRIWGVAPSLTPAVIFRNRRIDASPCLNVADDWDWIEFREYTERIRKSKPELPYVYSFYGYMNFLFHNGCALIDADTGMVKLDFENMVEPLKYLRDMVKNKIIPLYSDIYNRDVFGKLFSTDKEAMWESGSNNVGIVSKTVKDFDILPVPVAENCKRAIYSEQFSIMADSMNYNICWDFIKYSLSAEVQQYLADLSVNFPVRRDIRPKHFSVKQFKFMTNYIERCKRRLEDYYIPFQSRFVLETGVDRWIKHGGKLAATLKDLEHSCQWHIDNYVVKK